MVDHDVSKLTDQELEDIVRDHPPTSHIRTKSLDEINKRNKSIQEKKAERLFIISKWTLIFAIISAVAAIGGVVISLLK